MTSIEFHESLEDMPDRVLHSLACEGIVFPARVTDLDARLVFDAGFSEDALFDAISVCALYNFMNRIVEGCGVLLNDVDVLATKERHEVGERSATPYQDFMQASTVSSRK